MYISLLRHATAVDRAASDDLRRLSPEGKEEIAWLAQRLQEAGWKPGIILSSPFYRAEETADAVAARFPGIERQTHEVLAYGTSEALLWLVAGKKEPLLVGHEPLIGAFGARLLGMPMLPMPKAGILVLEVDRVPPTRPARLELFLSPRWRV